MPVRPMLRVTQQQKRFIGKYGKANIYFSNFIENGRKRRAQIENRTNIVQRDSNPIETRSIALMLSGTDAKHCFHSHGRLHQIQEQFVEMRNKSKFIL